MLGLLVQYMMCWRWRKMENPNPVLVVRSQLKDGEVLSYDELKFLPPGVDLVCVHCVAVSSRNE